MKVLFPIIASTLLIVGCNNNPSNGKENTPVDEDEVLLVDFNSYVFEGTSKEISTGSTAGTYEEALKAYINKEDTYLSGIITSGYSGIKKLEYEISDFVPFTILQLASGTSSASLTLRFAKTIKSVKIKAQAYYKAYMKTWNLGGNDPYAVYSLDADTTFSVNGTSWELPSADVNDDYEIVSMPEIVEKSFDINSRDLVLDDGEYVGRTFIHSIEFTF